MPRFVKAPPPMAELFEQAEDYVARRFANVTHHPEEGTVRVDGERFVMVRAESLYVGLCDGFVRRFGLENAFDLIYTMAWEIGQSDCQIMVARTGSTEPMQKIAVGPPFFAHCGWASVELLEDSAPQPNDDCFLHYYHPNTFESEVLAKRNDVGVGGPACIFSAGYSAGWVSHALGMELHAREFGCRVHGAEQCEFIMSPAARLDEHAKRLTGAEPA